MEVVNEDDEYVCMEWNFHLLNQFTFQSTEDEKIVQEFHSALILIQFRLKFNISFTFFYSFELCAMEKF